MLGVILGFITGWVFFKGTFCLVESSKCFRSDLNDRLLVEYHDGLVSMLNGRVCEGPPSEDSGEPRVRPRRTFRRLTAEAALIGRLRRVECGDVRGDFATDGDGIYPRPFPDDRGRFRTPFSVLTKSQGDRNEMESRYKRSALGDFHL